MICGRLPAWRALRRCAPFTLPGLAGLLLLLLGLEWLVPAPGAGPGPSPALPAGTAAAAADDSGQWAAIVLARPLFSPSRRPDVTASAGADGTLPRLSAIIVTGAGGIAIFSASGQKPQTLGVGGEIGGYRLQSISPDSVALRGPGGALTLTPQFIPAGTTGTPAAAPPAPGRALGPVPEQGANFAPLPRATASSNPTLYLEQNF